MALIKARKLARDPWHLLKAADGSLPALPAAGKVIVPLAVWRERRDELIARPDGVGVWLSATDEAREIAADLPHLQVVAVHFATFNDGRGSSTARLLRERYGWRGELRAIGDVLRDQIFYLMRCGFDAFELREGEDVEAVLGRFADFSETYQAAVDRPLPLFRRRHAAKLTGAV
jgi:uncharacterized protein (DUF934 family)